MLLKGKVVIITGAGGGLGRTHALAFAKEGAKVVVNDLGGSRDGQGTSSSMADQVVNEIKAMGGEAVANYDSVSDVKGAENIIQTAIKTFGRLDILVNNAGILRDKTLVKMEDDQWSLVQKVHMDGTFFCGRAAARYFVENKIEGRIINTSSIAGLKGNFGQTNYGAAKAGIAGMTKVWAMELGKYNITCNAIAPMAKTRMTTDIEAVPDDATPEQISPLVVFLASDLAKDVSGQIFGCHGGHYFEYKTVLTEGVKNNAWTPQEIAKQFSKITADAATEAPQATADTGTAAAADDNTPAGRIRKAFNLMAIAFTADKAAGWAANMQFTIAGADNYTVEVNNGTCKVTPGLNGTPTCKITTNAETMGGMIEGKVSGQSAFLSGKIKASNMGDMIKFGKVFDFKRAREAAAKNPALMGGGAPATATQTTGPAGTQAAAPAAGGVAGRIQKAFELMKVAFTADKAAGWDTNMHFIIEGADNYSVAVKGGTCTVQVGLQGTPTCKITTTADTMAGMIEGKISGQQAFLGGKIKASNMGDMMKFGKVFDFKRAREAAAKGGVGAQATGPTGTQTTATAAAAETATAAAPAANVDFDGLFKALPATFQAANAAGWNGKIVFDIAGTNGYTVDIANGKVDVKTGKETGAVCVISGTGADFTGFLTGKTEWANYKGKLNVNNQIALIKVAKVFNWKAPELAGFVQATGSTNTGGGLNKALIGKKYRAPHVLVKRERVIEYAQATNDPNPIYKANTPDKDLIAPPVFPVVLVGDLFREMLQDDTGMDFSRMVHGEQKIQIFSHLRPGDIVAPRGSIKNIETKASGGEVLTFEQNLFRDGELAVTITTSLFQRAAKKSDAPKEASIDKATDSVAGKPVFTYQVQVTGDQPIRYAKASGDNNPIHTDLEMAKAAGFPNVILHGLCTMAFTSQAVIQNKLNGDTRRLKDISVRFSKPVFPSETLTINAFEGSDGLSFVAVNNQGVPVITNGVAHFA